jgi:CBS domain-containing protein
MQREGDAVARGAIMKIQDVMSRQAYACHATDTLDVAARLMWDHDVGAAPVLGADGKLAGIITDRDIAMGACFRGVPLASLPVSQHMSRQVFTITPDHAVEDAEELMATRQVRRLPVVGPAGELLGMVTMGDLARAAVGAKTKEVDATAVARTVSRIVEPRSAPALVG